MQIRNKVLVVDDDDFTLKIITDGLEADYEVFSSNSSLEGLSMVKELFPDLIILDIRMPEMDGFEFCRNVKADDETSHIPIVFLTASSETEFLIEAFGVGAVDFMTKPANILELKTRLSMHITQSRIENDLFLQNLELNKKIKVLTDELSSFEDLIDKSFERREQFFSYNDE